MRYFNYKGVDYDLLEWIVERREDGLYGSFEVVLEDYVRADGKEINFTEKECEEFLVEAQNFLISLLNADKDKKENQRECRIEQLGGV